MEIEESMIVEILMDGDSHIVAYAHHGSEGVGAQAQMGVLTHIFEALSLLLHGVVAAAKTVDLNLAALQFDCLSGTLAFHQFAIDVDT